MSPWILLEIVATMLVGVGLVPLIMWFGAEKDDEEPPERGPEQARASGQEIECLGRLEAPDHLDPIEVAIQRDEQAHAGTLHHRGMDGIPSAKRGM